MTPCRIERLPSCRERVVFRGAPGELVVEIERLRAQGFRRSDPEPDRPGRYACRLVGAGPVYELIALQRREPKRRRRPAKEGR